MFGVPVPRPPTYDVLPLIWTYAVKSSGVKKASCICNENLSQRGSIILNHTYIAALEYSEARLF